MPPRCDPDKLRRQGVGLVRRPTGGLAVLHENEWTYAVVARRDGPPFGGSVLETYHSIAGMLLLALGSLGVEAREAEPSGAHAESPRRAAEAACFEQTSAHEITVAGRKLVGSAQARRGEAFVQHGSILVQADPERTASAVGSPEAGGHAVDLVEALGRRPGRAEFVDTLTAAVAARFDGELVQGRLGRDEAGRAALLRAWKYSSTEWTLDGRLGERERRWGLPTRKPAI